jgi:short-subunit dehydrogenase
LEIDKPESIAELTVALEFLSRKIDVIINNAGISEFSVNHEDPSEVAKEVL